VAPTGRRALRAGRGPAHADIDRTALVFRRAGCDLAERMLYTELAWPTRRRYADGVSPQNWLKHRVKELRFSNPTSDDVA
jgi:hypothetical protein